VIDIDVSGAVQLLVHLHHHACGPKGDYVGLGLAALASWVGLPGPGEAALVAAAILAAHHHLDLVSAVAVAWVGATVGGTAGWLAGLRLGRGLVTARGPFRRARLAGLERGDRLFARFDLLAVFLTPSWVAGIHGMRPTRFIPANLVSALVWALVFGVGAYVVGPSVLDLVDDLGLVSALVVVGLVLAVVGGSWWRRRRRRRGTRDS